MDKNEGLLKQQIEDALKVVYAKKEVYKLEMEKAEGLFWDLTKDDTHTTDDELKHARNMMTVHCQLVQITYLAQFLEIVSQDKVDSARVPVGFLCTIFIQEEVSKLAQVFNHFRSIITDNSAEIQDTSTFTEERIKGYLIELYEKQNDSDKDKDSAWESDSQASQVDPELDDVLFADEKELEALELEADKEENQELPEEQQQLQQQQANEEERQEEQNDLPDVVIQNFDPFIKVFPFHKQTVCYLAQNPARPEQFASCSSDESFTVFDIKADTNQQYPDQKETVSLIGFSSDGKYIATALINGTITVFNQSKDFETKQLEGLSSEPIFLEWHPKGPVLLCGGDDSNIWMWNCITGDVMALFVGHEGPLLCGGFSFNGKLVFSGSTDRTFRIWRPQTQSLIHKINGHGFHTDDVTCYSQHPEQSIIATGSNDKTVCLHNFDTGKPLIRSPLLKDAIVSICLIHTQQSMVACGDVLGNIYILNLSMRLIDTVSVCRLSITKILFDRQSHQFVASSMDGQVVMFDHRQNQSLKKIQTPSSIYDFLILENQKVLIGCENGSLYIY